MKPKIYIHGGMYKTASSALQNFLFDNRERLMGEGWYYPLSGLVMQRELGHRHFHLTAGMAWRDDYQYWDALDEELNGCSYENIILSHENFYSPDIDPLKVASLLSGYQIKLVIYVRHPVDYIESCYREWVRRVNQYRKNITEFYHWRSRWIEHRNLLKKWDDAIGAENVTVRLFDKKYFAGGTIESDFLTSVGIEGFKTEHKQAITNPGLNSRQTLLYLVRNRNFKQIDPDPVKDIFMDKKNDYRILSDLLIEDIYKNFYNDFLYAQFRAGSSVFAVSSYEALAYDELFYDNRVKSGIKLMLSALQNHNKQKEKK